MIDDNQNTKKPNIMNNENLIFELVSENLSNLGGQSGTEYTYANWHKYFTSIKKAKDFAQSDYKGKKRIGWKKSDTNSYCSGDLLYVMYHINPLKIEA
jgi:hypothetical protein